MSEELTARLDHIQLHTEAPERLAAFYREVMGMTARRVDRDLWLCHGPERRLLIGRGRPRSLGFAAYRVTSPDALQGLRARLERQGIELEPTPTPLFREDALAFRDPDGNLLALGRPTEDAPPPAGGMPARLQHVVVATCDASRMMRFYADVVGFRISDTVFDADQPAACFLRSDDEHHSFALFRAAEPRLDHHCYEAGDWGFIRDWADHFARHGLAIAWGPGRHGPGNNLFIMIHDPDDNWLEISAELEVVAHDRPPGRWPHEQRTLNAWGQAFLRS